MRLINIVDEDGRFFGFKADMSDRPQCNSHIVSYIYARENYYKHYPEEKIGLEVEDLKDNYRLREEYK
jgi:hypothetical protein